MSSTEIYERLVKDLPPEEQLRLVELIVRRIAPPPRGQEAEVPARKIRNIMELHGLGKEIWDGIDVQEYVESQRKEWEHRP